MQVVMLHKELEIKNAGIGYFAEFCSFAYAKEQTKVRSSLAR